MKKNVLPSIFFAALAMLTACGDDVTEVTEVHQDGIAVLEAGKAIGTCDAENAGDMLYVTDSAEVYFCDGKAWQSTKGADGEPGVNGVDGKAGKDGADGKPGAPGKAGADGKPGEEGTSCTAKAVENAAGLKGVEVTCGKTVVDTVWNGKAGADGKPGEEGTSCTAKAVENAAGLKGVEVTCGKTVIDTVWNGKDGEDGSGCVIVKDSAGVVTLACGDGESAGVTTLFKATCGSSAFDPATQYCSEGSIHEYGIIEDIRDGQKYRTVKIGNLIWMAENLNYSVNPGEQSWCGGGSDKTEGDCSKFGRLYTWAAAVGRSEEECGWNHVCPSLLEDEQGVCPEGSHLPSEEEWNSLVTAAGGTDVAGKMLKSVSGWNGNADGANGIDAFAFSAFPAGVRYNGSLSYVGSRAYFWLSKEHGSEEANTVYLNSVGDKSYIDIDYKDYGFSVRCVLDN